MAEQLSAIHDIGYQRYTGPRLGRGYAVRSLYTHSLRTAFGLGRGAKAKVFPWIVVGLLLMIAVVATAIRGESADPVLSYVEYPEVVTLLVLLFCATAGPELVSRDLRSGVLPLYFSRPLRRGDYVLARWAALVTATALPMVAAQLVMFFGAAFSRNSVREFLEEVGDLLSGLAYSGVHAFVFASVALLVASLASRRAVAAAAVVAVFIATTPVVGILAELGGRTTRQLAALASPMTIPGGIGDWLFEPGGSPEGVGDFGPVYGAVAVVLVAGCVLLLLARYRKVAR